MGTDEKVNKDFFYGLISDVEIYDITFSDDEIEISKKPSKSKLETLVISNHQTFLYSQILPNFQMNQLV